MKYSVLSVLAFLLLGSSAIAQSSKERVEFTYLQKPKFLLSTDKTYDVEIILAYEEELLAEKAAIEEENARLKEEAAKEKEEYEGKSTGEKLAKKVLLGEKKPTGKAELIEAPFYQNLWNAEEIKGKYVNIPGFTQEAGAKAKVEVYINKFEWTYVAQHIADKGYYYRVNATGTITMAAYNEGGEKIASETFQISQVGKANDFQSKYFKSAYDRDKDWNINKEGKLRSIEASKLDINMKSMEAYLRANMAFNEVSYKSIIFTFKSKKHNYDKLNAVYPQALEAYNMLNADPVSDATKAKIDAAMKIWEAALSELDKKDKKARINAEAGEALYLNLAQAAIWKEDFGSAVSYLAKYKVLDPKGRNSVYKDLQDLYDDQKARYEANK